MTGTTNNLEAATLPTDLHLKYPWHIGCNSCYDPESVFSSQAPTHRSVLTCPTQLLRSACFVLTAYPPYDDANQDYKQHETQNRENDDDEGKNASAVLISREFCHV